MHSELKNIIKVACIYVATIIGAGFASGQEIIQFFSVYYKGGFWGILLAGILFSAIGCIVLDRVYRLRIRSYDEFIFPALGWFAGWVVQIGVTVFMFCLFCIMIAGSGNVLSDKLGIPFEYAALIMGLLCMVFILSSIKGLVMLGTIVTPVLLAGIVLVGFYIIVYRDRSVFSSIDSLKGIVNSWFFSSLLYVSYNSLMSVVVMCNLLPYLKTKRTGRVGGILGGALLCFVALVLNTAIFMYYPGPAESELPVLGILGRYGSLAGSLYAILLWLAMLVSAVTSGFCFVDRVASKVSIDKHLLTIALCAAAVPLSTLGFSRLIVAIYPVFGYLGLFLVLVILMQGLRLLPLKTEARRRK
jgi:uncharacterized membrane protein YkvI